MNFKTYLIFFFIFAACATQQVDKKADKKADKEADKKEEIIIQGIFSNTGFTLLFEPSLKKKEIVSKSLDKRSLIIFQKNLKIDTLAKVGSKANYPQFYNSVISERIYNNLEIDISEPYVEIIALNNNSFFIANKAKTFEEEKKVADKAPVDGISIKDLNENNKKDDVKKEKNTFNYIIKIADFYFKDSAELMVKRIKEETKVNNAKIKNISNTSFRVFIGPYEDLNSLQKAFNDISVINFEKIELIKQ
jgi:hypothetical protein